MPWVGSAPPCGDQVPTWGQGPCTHPWWWRALLFASLEQELPLYHPPVTGMLVWHVGTRPHVAHRQSFRWADYLDRLSSLNFGPAVLMCLWPFGSGRMTNAATRWGILHLQRQGVAGWQAGLHLTRRCPASATQPPCANYSRLLVMRKSCKMDTGWASSWVLLSIPLRLQHTLRHLRCDWDDWHSSLGFLGARRLCRSARVQWRWQILVVQDLALSWQSWHPLLPFTAHLCTPGGTGDGGSGSCATE